MKQVYINKIEYYLPPKIESNKQLLETTGKDENKIKSMIKKNKRCLSDTMNNTSL